MSGGSGNSRFPLSSRNSHHRRLEKSRLGNRGKDYLWALTCTSLIKGQLAVVSRTPALLSQSQAKDKSFGLPFLASPVYQNDLLTLVLQNNCRTEYSAITFSQAFRDERKACLIEIHLEDIDKNKRKGFWLKKHCWLMSGNK